MAKYIHLYRNKWLKVEPEHVNTKYCNSELDKNDKEFSDKEKVFHKIVISEKRPQ